MDEVEHENLAKILALDSVEQLLLLFFTFSNNFIVLIFRINVTISLSLIFTFPSFHAVFQKGKKFKAKFISSSEKKNKYTSKTLVSPNEILYYHKFEIRVKFWITCIFVHLWTNNDFWSNSTTFYFHHFIMVFLIFRHNSTNSIPAINAEALS